MTPDQATDEVGPFQLVRRVLLDLAQHEEHLATSEAAGVPYWRTLPPSVGEHRAAANVLRNEADRFASGS
jgi:hypothetical protein